MGISYEIMSAMLREAAVRPFAGTSYSIGRQSMGATPEAVQAMFARLGLTPATLGHEPRTDEITTMAKTTRPGTILDTDFYRMLGMEEHLAVDISDFEGAEVILNLNEPLPDHLEKSCDLLVDGSTLDNIFDPPQGLRNLSRMLKTNGRLFLSNLSNTSLEFNGIPYTMFNPLWFYDYFAINNYKSCEVYAMVHDPRGTIAYRLSHEHTSRRYSGGMIPAIASTSPISIVVFAEKGDASTWALAPTQHAYRPEEEWARFERAVDVFRENERPGLVTSSIEKDELVVPAGWYRVTPQGEVVLPAHLWRGPHQPLVVDARATAAAADAPAPVL